MKVKAAGSRHGGAKRGINFVWPNVIIMLVLCSTEEHPTHNHQILTVVLPQREYKCRVEDGKYHSTAPVSPVSETGNNKPDEMV